MKPKERIYDSLTTYVSEALYYNLILLYYGY